MCSYYEPGAVFFWVPFTDEETEAGRGLLSYPADLDIGGTTEFISLLFEEAVKLTPDEV